MHIVDYIEAKNKREVKKEASYWFLENHEYARKLSDYSNSLTFHEAPICLSHKEARELLEERYTNWDFHDHAVRYHDSENVGKTQKIKSLEERKKKNLEMKEEYIEKNSLKNRKSKSITCPCCDSRLTISYLKGYRCPLCDTDLRSKTVQDRIKKFGDDDKNFEKEIKAEKKKLARKAPIKWLVKVEAHC